MSVFSRIIPSKITGKYPFENSEQAEACEKRIFALTHGYDLNLDNPKSFSERICVKKLRDRNPLLPIVADKFKVRELVKERLGDKLSKEILIPLLWSGNKPSEIPFDQLPNRFILKANHGSRMNLISTSKPNAETRKKIISTAQEYMDRPFGLSRSEWCYQEIERQIVIETLINVGKPSELRDYKFYMFNGKLGLIMAAYGKGLGRKTCHFNAQLNREDIRKGRHKNVEIDLPEQIHAMIEIAEKLSSGFDHIRVDLYCVDGQIKFGELTNYSGSGRIPISPVEADFRLGRIWEQFNEPKKIEPKLAIAVQKYHHSGQTFVNRHIGNLFGGNSIVISERHYQEPIENNTPAFVLADHIFNIWDLMRIPYFAYYNFRYHHCFRVPFGRHRRRLVQFIAQNDANAILSEFGSQSMLVTDIGKKLGLPVFCYFRGRDASYWLTNKTRVRAYKKVFANLSGVFAVSQFLLDNLAAKGLAHPNSFAIPSGTDIDLFKPNTKDPGLFLAVGRFVDKKAPHVTVQSFLDASQNISAARLELIGGGPELARCQAIVDAAGAQDRVIFHNQQDSVFIAEKLKSASVFLQHSVIDKTGEAEGLPSSIQEAMAAGCAIISTNHAGIPELVIENETGMLVQELDHVGFTNAITYALNNPAQINAMGVHSRKIAEERIDYRKLYKIVETVITKSISENN